jgi:hypothetical protein
MNDSEEGGQSSKPRWRGGRPRMNPAERRTADLPHVRVTTAELEKVRARAEELGLPIAELIRRSILEQKTRRAVPAINRELWGRLGQLATNLNQYMRALRQGQTPDAPTALLEQLGRELAALREALLGRDSKTQ